MAVGDTYTNPAGPGVMGNQAQALQDALSKIQGAIPQPAAVQQDMQASKTAYNIQGDRDYYNKLLALAQHDVMSNNPGQSFQAPDQQTPADAPSYGGVNSNYGVPILTQQSNAAPTTGFTDPLLAARAAGAQFGGVKDTLSMINNLIQGNYDNLQNNLKDKASMYSSKMSAAQGMTGQVLNAMQNLGLTPKDAASLALEERKQRLAEFNAGMPGSGNGTSDIYDYVDGLQSGKYTIDQIPDQYRQAVSKRLSDMGTSTEKIRQAKIAVDAITERLNQIYDRFNKMSPQDFLNPTNADKAFLDSSMQFLSEKVQRANIGGRITQTEIANAISQLPGLSDKLAGMVGGNTAKSKLDSLFSMTTSASGMDPSNFKTNWSSGTTSGTSSDVDSKLSSAGYSPSQIAEYKRLKGIK